MARSIATNTPVELDKLLDFVRPRHRLLLATTRRNGRPQISPVSGGVDPQKDTQQHERQEGLVGHWCGPWLGR